MKQISEAIADEIKNLRRLTYLIELPMFAALYSAANDAQKLRVDLAIKDRNANAVKTWIDNQRVTSLSTMSLIDLKQTAKGLQIPKCDKFNKDQLISLIMEKRNERGTTEDHNSCPN